MPPSIKSLKVSAKLHARVRIAAAVDGSTIQEFVESALYEKLARRATQPRHADGQLADGQLEAGYDLLAEVPR